MAALATKTVAPSAVKAPPAIAPSSGKHVARKISSPARPRVQLGTLLPMRIQPAMRISTPRDPAEREAESTAQRIMQMTEPPALRPAANDAGQRRLAPAIARTRLNSSPLLAASLMRQAASAPRAPAGAPRQVTGEQAASAEVEREIVAAAGTGAPLPENLRRFMEPRFRADFKPVRIHTDARAARLARRVNARAFTYGRDIFFGNNEFRPDSRAGAQLIAHELTHTIQQRAAIQREEAPVVAERAPEQVQRLGISDALDYFADKANLIPGFRMFTIVLGVNPVNMSRADRSAANILRALVELVPGGSLIAQALDQHGVFERAGAWVEQQINTLGMTGAAIKAAIDRFIDSLSWSDIFDLGGVWERAKAIFTDPIRRLIDFGKSIVSGIVKFVKDAVLMPLARLAQGTRGWDLLCAVLGKNPITDEPVPQTAENLVGGFMKFIGQEEVWKRIQETGAIAKVWAWFQNALATVKAFVARLPALAIAAFHALEISDFLLLPRAIGKIIAVFGDFAMQFITWAGQAVWNLLEIVFSVVSPGAWTYIQKTGAALKSILRNPLPFIGNLVRAAKGGFDKFAGNFLTHLKAGLIEWLTGSLPGIYIPKSFELTEIAKFVMSVLGLTWANIRAKLVRAIGETAVTVLETAFDIVVTLVRDGPAAAWDKIKEQLTNLKDMVIGGITDMVVNIVVTKAIPKLVAMFIPGAGFISAIISIYETVMVFVDKIKRIIQVVTAFIDSIVAIAGGQIGAAVTRVESILAGLLSLAISFLAGFAGLGRVSDKIKEVLERVRRPIDRALDWLVNWIVTAARRLGRMVTQGARNLIERLYRRRGFGSGRERHNTWIAEDGTPMVATELMPLSDRIASWRSRLGEIAQASRPQVRDKLNRAHELRVMIASKSREVIAAQRRQDEATIRSRQQDIETHYQTLTPILGELFQAFGDVSTQRGGTLESSLAALFNSYDREVLPLKRGRPPLVRGSPVTIYSKIQALWNQDQGWAYQMATGIRFQMERVLVSARRVGTSSYPQLTGVEVYIPPFQQGGRRTSSSRVDYTEKNQAISKTEFVEIAVEVKRYGASDWDDAKIDREIGKIRRQIRASINSNNPKYDVVRLEIGGFSNTPQEFRAALTLLWSVLEAEASRRNIKLETRRL